MSGVKKDLAARRAEQPPLRVYFRCATEEEFFTGSMDAHRQKTVEPRVLYSFVSDAQWQ